MDTDLAFKLAELPAQIAELGSSIRQWIAPRFNCSSRESGRDLKSYDHNADNPSLIKALADVRRVARRGGSF